jgi:hypothetical protein
MPHEDISPQGKNWMTERRHFKKPDLTHIPPSGAELFPGGSSVFKNREVARHVIRARSWNICSLTTGALRLHKVPSIRHGRIDLL